MNRYVIIRSDTKSISSPMNKKEAISKVKEYDKQGISSYIVSKNEGNRRTKYHFVILSDE
ncbi:hypothetical protein [Tepidibacter formicigenes]|uniref:Uncharacterized protein n=1 Tax=Tepidibacter formicigenes DSM 15518 TaxID=1123349 RepID=A0A1M6PHQ4_9FIRM|nr:hypothetical protein [Tepidibacter formicigenes]SHK07444.1 hypothetical protein SAMN02744037_01569 [Tepidibacter formicigenes DSM 15518]